jgi:Flp pilus assembly protein TadD
LPNKNQQSIGDLNRQAQQQIDRGQNSNADRLCRQILEISPDHAEAHFLIGVASLNTMEVSGAIEFIEKAINLEPGHAKYYAQLGRCLVMLARDLEAVDAAEHSLRLEPTDALTLDTVGCIYSYTGNHEKALDPFRRAVIRKPDDPSFHFNLAVSLRFSGHFDEAEVAYEKAIEFSPRFYRAHLSLSTVRKQTKERNHIKRLEQLVQAVGGNVDAKLHLHHALAKEYEDTGRYEESFASLEVAKSGVSEKIGYSIDDDINLFGELQEQFSDDKRIENTKGYPVNDPIFIVGMPRTGTTLADRILSSHSLVKSAGELPYFGISLKRASHSTSNQILDPETVRKAMDIDFWAQGEEYLRSARPSGRDVPYFIDKLPLNFLYIGFIRMALPNAKIICLRRHPLDTCISNFRQLFDIQNSYYHYSLDIMDTAKYYLLFHQLMAHWNRLLPGSFLEVKYEDLVKDQETESRRIVEYCGLQWEDACLAFDENTSTVATASSVQVREPLYQSAVGRWRHYEEQLEPVRKYLESEGIAIS